MAEYILHDNDGAIDKASDAERKTAERHHIYGYARKIHERKCRHHRYRYRQCDYDRAPKVAQEIKQNKKYEEAALPRGVPNAADGAFDKFRLVVYDNDIYIFRKVIF